MRLGMMTGAAALALAIPSVPALGQSVYAVGQEGGIHAGQLDVPLNKSQVVRVERPYSQALIGNAEVADVLPLTNESVYVLGKKVGTTSLTFYDRNKTLIAVVDIAVGPDVVTLKRQLAELLPKDEIGARMSNDAVVLTGVVSSAPIVQRAVQIAETYAPGKVVNMLSVGASQQVMLEVRFSEIKRQTGKEIGVGSIFSNDSGSFQGVTGNEASLVSGQLDLGAIVDSFGILAKTFTLGGLNVQGILDALERKGVVTTLAEPTLVALSGETASFLAGGEFPVPILRGGGGSGGDDDDDDDDDGIGGRNITVQFKPFGVSLAFTPTVLEDGIINLVVAPEVSSIDPSASIEINGLVIPGLQTRRAKTTVELRDGESFALAGLLRKDFEDTVQQFPILGSIPIIGSLFRSTGFRKEDTELVIIVTPRLVKPVRAAAMKLPTDRVQPPEELDLFLMGRTDSAVDPISVPAPVPRSSTVAPIGEVPRPLTGAERQKTGFEGDYGHIVE